ncbi:RagB/SusD family nutrient uptake outer membrane protein [Limibacter armeniacum]|uniref:RagB/SusD family nutrient uptake outer membrane protein n=1 Tax=Limibacter armeniacum TaxID=466084 RepID=UPI002FE5615D
MKKRYILGIVCLLIFSACEEQLELKPLSSITDNKFYETDEEIESAVLSVYSGLQVLTDEAWILEGLRDDNAYPSSLEGTYGFVDNFSDDESSPFSASYWTSAYDVIARANTVLKYVGNVTDDGLRSQLEGEAKFLRAYTYFKLVRLFGNVPLVLETIQYDDAEKFSNSTPSEIYTAIEADLKDAISMLPEKYASSEAGRATQFAAKGILAKVLITMGGKEVEAKQLLSDIIGSGQFSLMDNYKEVFESEQNKEVIFAVRYAAQNGEHQTFSYTFSANGFFGGVRPSQELMDIYEDNDVRFEASAAYDEAKEKWIINKFNSLNTPEMSGVDWIALRYADILLLYAELANELSPMDAQATQYLNEIRERAGLAPVTVASQAELRDAIRDERRVELAFEGHRWFDLLRYGNAVNIMRTHLEGEGISALIEDYKLLYAIPRSEILLSKGKLVQNPGYQQ